MKYTLLELTQNILSSMDGEEIESINDTAESKQVSQLIRTAYFNILSRANLPELKKLFQFGAGDADSPVLMTIADDIAKVDWVKYDISTDATVVQFEYVTILPEQQFLDMMHGLDTSATDVDSLTFNGLTYYFQNDKEPQYCTVLNDRYFLFDSYDSDVETFLAQDKSLGFGLYQPTFTMSDVYTPELDDQQFPLLLNEAKSLCFLELKQIEHNSAIREARRQWSSLQKNKDLHKASDFDRLPYFGRR